MPLSNTDVQLASVSSSASTFPQLSSSEIDILSQILCCTPSDTTAFNALLRPYRDTLQKNSIDPKKDEKFYSFLLKLSLVPGSDWRTKWQKVLSEQLSLKSKHSGHRPSSLAKINSHAVPSTSRIQALQSKPSKSVHFLPLGELVRTSDDPTLPAQPTLTKVSYPDFESPRFTDPSDVIARRARRRQLLQHFLNRWQIEIIKWHELASEVDKARITIDKSLAYQTWKQKAKYLNNKSNAVTRAYETRTLEIGLKRWRDLSYFQRQKKWRNLMKKTYQNIQTVSKQELCRRVLIIWVNHVRSSAFYMSSSRNLVLRLLRNWVHNTRNIDRLRSVSDNFQLQVDIAQVRYLLKRWQYIRVTNLKVDQFLAANKLQRKSRVYAYWRYLCYQRQKARVQLFKSRLRQFFKSLRSSYEYQLLLKQTVIRVTILRDQNNKLKFFRHWVIYERGIFLERARKTRLLRLCLRLWSHKMEFVTIRLPTIGRQLKLRYPFLLSHSLLLQWRERICMIHHYQEKSIHRYESSIIRKFYLAWKSKRERCLQSILVSAISRKKLVCAKLFKIWNRKAHKRKQIIWLQLRTIRHLQFNFTVWKEAVRLRRRLLGNILEFQFVIQKRLRGKIFLKWRSRKDFLSENTFLAKSENLQRLKRKSWRLFYKRYNDFVLMRRAADLINAEQNKKLHLSLMTHWANRAHKLKLMSLDATIIMQSKDLNLLRSIVARWNEIAMERSLRDHEKLFVSLNNRYLKRNTWNRWTVRSSALIAIRNFKQRTVQHYFILWIESARLNSLLVSIQETYRRVILRRFFFAWLKRSMNYKASMMISRLRSRTKLNG